MAEVVVPIEVYGYPGRYSIDVRPDKTRVAVGERVAFACLVTVDGIPVQGATIEIRHTPPAQAEHVEASVRTDSMGKASWAWVAELPVGTHAFLFRVLVPEPYVRPIIWPGMPRLTVASPGQLVEVARAAITWGALGEMVERPLPWWLPWAVLGLAMHGLAKVRR